MDDAKEETTIDLVSVAVSNELERVILHGSPRTKELSLWSNLAPLKRVLFDGCCISCLFQSVWYKHERMHDIPERRIIGLGPRLTGALLALKFFDFAFGFAG